MEVNLIGILIPAEARFVPRFSGNQTARKQLI